MNISELEKKNITELHKLAQDREITGYARMRKKDLIFALLKKETEIGGNIFAEGVLEVIETEGYGFIRPSKYLPSSDDIYISASQIRRFDLRTGDVVSGQVREPKDNERYFALLRIEAVNYQDPEKATDRAYFDDLTPLYPRQRLRLEHHPQEVSSRLVDIISPIGLGQRGLIVSPPKAGKTILLKKIANSIRENHPSAKMMILLIDERPEEVTDMERSVDAEVVSSTFDHPADDHIQVSELALAKAKRLVEHHHDVVILLDSITRLARAANVTTPPSGRTLSGGLDPTAMHFPKRFFGAGRNIEEGGSLTVLATALVNTGSRMDDMIYEEFKGTGNMELHLDRRLAERRIFPALDIQRSGTRKEELLLEEEELQTIWKMRRETAEMDGAEMMRTLIKQIKNTSSNKELLAALARIFNH